MTLIVQSNPYWEAIQVKKIYAIIIFLIFISTSSLPTIRSNSYVPEDKNDKSYDMLIVAPTIFTEPLQPLIDHKNGLGISTFLKTTEEIYSEYSGVDGAEQIKYCIKDMIETHGIQYVMLVGNGSYVPIRYSHLVILSESFPSDLYYADIYNGVGAFENWDSNGNGIFAEWTDTSKDILDLYPDICVGRIPCQDEGELATYIAKIIHYELYNTAPWFTNVLLCGGDTCPSEDDVYEGECINDEIAAVLGNETFSYERLWASTGTLTIANINDAIHTGVGFIDFSGHGQSDLWKTNPPHDSSTWIPPNGYTKTNASSLTNGNKLPIIIIHGSQCCNIGAGETTLADAFLFNSHGGSIGVIGATDYSYSYCSEYYNEGLFGDIEISFFNSYTEGVDILGEVWVDTILNHVNNHNVMQSMGDCLTVEEFILLGDPSLKIGGYAAPYPIVNIDTGEGFNSIQAAIDDSDTIDGHNIYVSAGTYNENLIVNKALHLIGQDTNATIINGEFKNICLSIQSDDVLIKNFCINNFGFGIYIYLQ